MSSKYARELIELMGAYPGRDWRMAELVRYATATRRTEKDETVRMGVRRAVSALMETGAVVATKPDDAKLGKGFRYAWRE